MVNAAALAIAAVQQTQTGPHASQKPELTPEQVREMNAELRALIATRIEGRMHSRNLREDPARDRIISSLYARYLETEGKPSELLYGADLIIERLEQAKKLAALADLIDGKPGTVSLKTLYSDVTALSLIYAQRKASDPFFCLTPESLVLEQKEKGTFTRFWNQNFSQQVSVPTNHHEPERIAQMAGVDPSQIQIFSANTPINHRLFRSTGSRWSARPLEDITTVVCHESAGPTLEGAIRTLQRRKLSYHFIIDRDGTIYQLQPIEEMAPHARRLGNRHGIGVCLVGGGSSEEHGRATEAQEASLASLTNTLREKAPNLANVMLHKEVSCCCTDCNAAGADMHRLAQRTGLRYNPDAI